MGWHLSRSNPAKVYDERHTEVCICHTAEAARMIVLAVNFLRGEGVVPGTGEHIKLREPEPPKADALTHVTGGADGCCASPIRKASLSGVLDRMQPWECPKCGTTYWPKREGPLVSWEARAAVMVFKS